MVLYIGLVDLVLPVDKLDRAMDRTISQICKDLCTLRSKVLVAKSARFDRKCGRWFDLSVKHPSYFPRDTKIPISG